jgi:PAS domain-containing protein
LVFDIDEVHGLGVFENWELRRIFGLKREEMIGGWRKFSLPNVIRMVKFRRIRGRACSTHEGGDECIQGFGGKVRRKETDENQVIGGRIILKCERNRMGWYGLD